MVFISKSNLKSSDKFIKKGYYRHIHEICSDIVNFKRTGGAVMLVRGKYVLTDGANGKSVFQEDAAVLICQDTIREIGP